MLGKTTQLLRRHFGDPGPAGSPWRQDPKWTERFLALAARIASWSKDPELRSGAVVIGSRREILSAGYNGFPRGIADAPQRLADPDYRRRVSVGAEENTVGHAARIGAGLDGGVVFATHPPTARAARTLIQAGLSAVVHAEGIEGEKSPDEDLLRDRDAAHAMLHEAGLRVLSIPMKLRLPRAAQGWEARFFGLAREIASWSKDPSTKVGAVAVGPDREILSAGYNGPPRRVADLPSRLHERETKYLFTVHAEENAVASAAMRGVSLKGARLFLTWPPCASCARTLVQAGIAEIVYPAEVEIPERWVKDMSLAFDMLREAGVGVRSAPENASAAAAETEAA